MSFATREFELSSERGGGGEELGDNRRWTSSTGKFWFCFTLLCD